MDARPSDSSPIVRSADLGGVADLFGLSRRQRPLIIASAAILFVVFMIAILRIVPTYTSQAIILVDGRKTQVTNFQDVLQNIAPDQNAVRSEVDVLRSRSLALSVADKLALETNSLFMKDISIHHGVPIISHLPLVVQSLLFDAAYRLGMVDDAPETPPTVSQAHAMMMSKIVDKMLDHMTAYTDGKSNTIRISYTSESPELATQVINTWADLYIVSQLDTKYQATKAAQQYLAEQIAVLRQQATDTDQAVAAFRAAHNLQTKDMAGTTINTGQLAELNTQLIVAQAALAEKRSVLESFQQSLKNGQSGAASPEVIASPLIGTLRAQEAQIVARKAELEEQYGPRHPQIIQITAQLRDVRGSINTEIEKIMRSLQNAVDAARIRFSQLQSSMTTLQSKAGVNDADAVRLRELDREAQSVRMVYDNLLNRSKELGESGVQQADARVVSKSDVPIDPSFPNRKLFAVIAAIAAAMLAMLLSLLRERLDKGIRSQEFAENLTGKPCVAMLPAVSNAAQAFIAQPMSPFAEAIRQLTAAYTFLAEDKRIVLITSAVAGEGKSVTSLSLARSAAMSGKRVLLIDCDLRRPTMATLVGGRTDCTLADYLMQKCNFDAIFQEDRAAKSNLVFITARHDNPLPPQDILNSKAMREFLRNAREQFDLIVLDSPPVMAGADTQILARLAENVLFCVQWEKTQKQMVMNSIKMLRKANAEVSGVILTRVNVKKHRRYGFHDMGHYYGDKAYAPR